MAFLSPAIFLFSIVLALAPAVYAIQGNATYYSPPYTPSTCFGERNYGSLVAGVREELWSTGAACGRKYRATCLGRVNKAPHPCKSGNIMVTVVDLCEPKISCRGIINLSKDAFNVIADINVGKIRVRIDS